MKTTSLRAKALACALLAGTAYCGLAARPASAQEASVVAFPVRQFLDEQGVDLFSGVFTTQSPSVSIGSAEMGLTYVRAVRAGVFRDSMMGSISVSGTTYDVDIGGASETFTYAGGVFTPVEQNGSSLALSGGTYTYRLADGTIATFLSTTRHFGNAAGRVITSLAYPSGRSLTFHYGEDSWTSQQGAVLTGRRLQSVTTNAGYHMKLSYQSDIPSGPLGGTWARLANVKGLNSAVDSCDVFAFSCPQTGRPELGIPAMSGLVQTYVDSEGRTTQYTLSGGVVTGVRYPGSVSDDVSIAYSSGKVSSITRGGVATLYSFADASGFRTATVTRPGGATRILTFDIAKRVLVSDQDELARTTAYQHDSSNRVTRVTAPEGNYTAVLYDGRGNVTETRSVAKPGSGLPDIVASALYDSSCTVAVRCNKPNSVTDARGSTTVYTYDSGHGGLLTATAPAVGGVSPETRITYVRLDSSGTPSASGIYMPYHVSQCRTGASCANAADEVKTFTTYGQGLLPVSISTGSGDNALIATSAMTYDVAGNLLTVDGPLGGSADTLRFRYNMNRERIGTISPDPDGGGALKHRAVRTVIDSSTGLVTKVERGTVDSQSDGDWAAFSALEAVETGYDSNRRPVTSKLVSGGTVYALTQTSYDGRGRPECTAQRMNPAEFGSLPADACTLDTQGGYGPDRIVRTIYDPADQVTQVKTALGTADEANEITTAYTANGQPETVTDGENNKTTYEYDGHDRLARTRFPDTAKGSLTSAPASGLTADFEARTYELLAGGTRTSGLVASFRNRAGETIGFGYDALGRQISKDLPGTEPNVTYGYDLLGRLTSASQTGHALTFTYDALGRVLDQTGPLGTVASQWDIAGRRTKLTWPDTFYVTYDHLVTGETTAIRENGAASGIGVLATLAYDNLGRRTGLTLGNGVATTYAYDPLSRLDELKLEFAGTSDDLISEFAYNPASQIASTLRSNDAYAWTGHGSGTLSTTSNGLNQIANWVNTLGHDSKGNITTDGAYTYTYSSENLLTSLTNPTPGAIQSSSTYAYDPLMRLAVINSSNPALDASLGYDGADFVYEGLSDNRTRRYVRGPGVDEPLVAYLVTSTDTSRLWYQADERGSIVRHSNDSGTPGAIGKFDEYGVGGTGRIRYAGQYWLADGNLIYSRARIYSPTLGRFLQTDPIGYGDGMNMYAYVGGDPLNFTDPSGMKANPGPCAVVTGSRIPKCGDDLAGALAGIGIFGYFEIVKGVGGGVGGKSVGSPQECVAGSETPACVITITGQRLNWITLVIRSTGRTLDDLAERYLKPPDGRRRSESYDECFERVAPEVDEMLATGFSMILAGFGMKGLYPYNSPGSGTSVVSILSRDIFGNKLMTKQRFGSISRGGAIGRVASKASVGGGAAIFGFGIGKGIGADQICKQSPQ